jgi:hypothetical protein
MKNFSLAHSLTHLTHSLTHSLTHADEIRTHATVWSLVYTYPVDFTPTLGFVQHIPCVHADEIRAHAAVSELKKNIDSVFLFLSILTLCY